MQVVNGKFVFAASSAHEKKLGKVPHPQTKDRTATVLQWCDRGAVQQRIRRVTDPISVISTSTKSFSLGGTFSGLFLESITYEHMYCSHVHIILYKVFNVGCDVWEEHSHIYWTSYICIYAEFILCAFFNPIYMYIIHLLNCVHVHVVFWLLSYSILGQERYWKSG